MLGHCGRLHDDSVSAAIEAAMTNFGVLDVDYMELVYYYDDANLDDADDADDKDNAPI